MSFYICLDLHYGRGNLNSLKNWVEYIFPILDGNPEDFEIPVEDIQIAKVMA